MWIFKYQKVYKVQDDVPRYLYSKRALAQIIEGMVNLALAPFDKQCDMTMSITGEILRHAGKARREAAKFTKGE